MNVVGVGIRVFAWSAGVLVIIGTIVLIVAALSLDMPAIERDAVSAAPRPARVCPPVIAIPPRPADMPKDDVFGVRPGLSRAEAEEMLYCRSEQFDLQTDRIEASAPGYAAHTLMSGKLGSETIHVALLGPPGQERVAAVWREAFFDAGAGRPMAEIETALADDFGAPHEAKSLGPNGRELIWVFAPDGKPLRTKAVKGSKTYIQDTVGYLAAGLTTTACANRADLDPREPIGWDTRCGLTLRAQIDPGFGGDGKASRWRLAILDQQVAARQAGPAPMAPQR